jgi:hypothetical protein
MKWNVVYDRGDGTTSIYNGVPLNNVKEAEKLLEDFKEKYVGKQYPNKKGWYSFANPRIEPILSNKSIIKECTFPFCSCEITCTGGYNND